MIFGWTYPKRKEHLEKLANSPSDKTQLIEKFQGKSQYFKIYTVSIDLPKYRLANGRTYAAQAEYLAGNPNVEKEIFEKDLESDEAQKIQHQLLKDMLGKNEKDLIYFFKDNEQTEALILTYDGFVINGNRRLCAMRELYAIDKKQYQRFEHINIVILPPATEKDIDELEAVLQIAPDIKEEYTWYARALKYRKKRQQHNYKSEDLASIDKINPAEVDELIDLLNYADAYLADRGWKDEYHRLEQTKYAFLELRKARDKFFNAEPEKACFEKLAYCLIDGSTTGGRLYETIPAVAKYFDQFVERLRHDFDLTPKPIDINGQEDDLFGSIDHSNLGDVIEALSDPSKYQDISQIAADVVIAEKQKVKEKEKVNFVITQVRKAGTLLLDATASLNAHQQQDGIEEQLKSIEGSIDKIREWLK